MRFHAAPACFALCAIALFATLVAQTASAAPGDSKAPARAALVIANETYQHLNRLRTPLADGKLVAESLTSIGFDVTLANDLTLEAFEKTLRDFARKISQLEAPIVAFYYAGHGAQIEGRNYFFPVEMKYSNKQSELILNAIDVNLIVDWIEKGNPKGRNLIFLDGCRDDPLQHGKNIRIAASAELPKGVVGLTRIGDNTVVVFSTPPGAVAIDLLEGPGIKPQTTSPFARAFAKAIVTPGLDFVDFFIDVQFTVLEETFGRQKPLAFGTMPKRFSLSNLDGRPSDQVHAADALTRARRVAIGPRADGDPEFVYTGSFALLIGVSRYGQKMFPDQKPWSDLPGVEDDIKRVDKVLKERHGFETTIVRDPTHEQLQESLRKFFSVHGRKDDARLLVYYAGHGHTTKNHGLTIGWVVPSDAPDPDLFAEEFALTSLSMRRIQEFSEFIKARHILWVFDSCFSGSIFDMNMRSRPEDAWQRKLYERPMRRVITSGSEKEEVPDKSIFAELFVEVLEGKRQVGGSGSLFTANELGEYLKREVYKYREGRQTPQNGVVAIRNLDSGEIVFRLEPTLAQRRQ